MDKLKKNEFLIMAQEEILRFKVSREGEIQAKRAIQHDLEHPDSKIVQYGG